MFLSKPEYIKRINAWKKEILPERALNCPSAIITYDANTNTGTAVCVSKDCNKCFEDN